MKYAKQELIVEGCDALMDEMLTLLNIGIEVGGQKSILIDRRKQSNPDAVNPAELKKYDPEATEADWIIVGMPDEILQTASNLFVHTWIQSVLKYNPQCVVVRRRSKSNVKSACKRNCPRSTFANIHAATERARVNREFDVGKCKPAQLIPISDRTDSEG